MFRCITAHNLYIICFHNAIVASLVYTTRRIFFYPEARINIRMSSYQYRDHPVKDKTVSLPSYRNIRNTHTWRRRSSYWNGTQKSSQCYHDIVLCVQCTHYGDVIMDAITSQITSLTIVYSIVYSDADQRKHQSSASLAFVRRIHRGPVNSPHKWPVTRKMFPFDDVIMIYEFTTVYICVLWVCILYFETGYHGNKV